MVPDSMSNCLCTKWNAPKIDKCSYNYLGFILDDHLNFNKHMNEMINIVSLLSRIRKYLNKEACTCILIF